MQIEIAWSDNAIALLGDIYSYLHDKSQAPDIQLYNKLLDWAEPLRAFPQAGLIEPLLDEYEQHFRSLVIEKHYKLIYSITIDLIEIHAIWDCRQESKRLKEMFK